jgi:multidrug efflux system membrane fusion protein
MTRSDRFKLGIRRLVFLPAGVVLMALGLVFLAACSPRETVSQGARVQTAPVTVARVVQESVPVEVRAIGNVEAYSTVSVKAEVAAQVEQVLFREGQDVKKGDLLFTMDARPYQAALQQLEANQARDEAQLQNARAQDERYTRLFQEGIVSKDQYDTFHTNRDALAAAVQADKAAIEKAKVDLGYCSIRSPLDGRTGTLLIHPGNVVKDRDTVLVVINQIHPIYVTFAVPEQDLPDIKRYQAAGPLRVEALIPEDKQGPVQGALSFVDNAVDTTTGTIKLKGTFENSDNRLWPGQFVNVVLKLTSQANALVVPSQAVQTGQSGQYVFVIKPNMTAESRPVVTGSTIAGETVIEQGLQAGETVVTDGQLRLAPGTRVELKKQ